MNNEVLYQCELKKYNVTIYKNRIEYETINAKLGNLLTKGLTGKITIYFKNLSAIEDCGTMLEFITAGMSHIDSTTGKTSSDNCIIFTNKELNYKSEIIDVINELM